MSERDVLGFDPVANAVIYSLQAENDRLRRLTVRIFDECGAGFGHPDCNYLAVCVGGYLHCNKCGLIEKDASCDGTGRVLRDGAMRVLPHSVVTVTDDTFLVFPASWMEAGDG